jgi:GNAT superfamily N-acetyltransferase/predicted CoA-binding protein
MSIRNLDRLLKPRSLALIGATPRPGSVGAVVERNIIRAGFPGELMLVNPHHHAIDGLSVFPDIASLPCAPDLAVIATPPQTVPSLIGALGEADGVVALDARLRVASVPATAARRLAIAPYPQELAGEERLRDGTVLNIRPIHPEDEPLLHDLAAHMTSEDLRLRFFTPVRGLTHTVAARLSQLDYDREMALIALYDGAALGAVHFFADPDNRRAEYAIAVRSHWQGRGVGYLLMNRLIDIARQRGIGQLVGEVLRENESMLQMCRELGFTTAMHLDDPALMRVQKRLLPN